MQRLTISYAKFYFTLILNKKNKIKLNKSQLFFSEQIMSLGIIIL